MINEIKRNSGFIKVLASEAAGRFVKPEDAEDAARIVAEPIDRGDYQHSHCH